MQREKNYAARIESLKQTFGAHIKSKQVDNAKKTFAALSKDLPDGDRFITVEAPEQLAGLYLDLASGTLAQKDFEAAIDFAKSGLRFRPEDAQLRTALKTATGERARLAVAAPAAKPATPVPAAPAPLPMTAPPAPAPQPPAVSAITAQQVLGDWCGDNVRLTLSANELSFLLPGGNTASYPITQYDFAQDTFTILWSDKQRGGMETQFGNLASDNKSLVQMRGRSLAEKKWNDYNRLFRRCP
jgi:hypothetical protein